MKCCCEIVENGYGDCNKCYENEKGMKRLEELGVDLSKKLTLKELEDIKRQLKN